MPYGMQVFIFTYVFLTVLGMLLGYLGLASVTLITPVVFSLGSGLFMAAIALGKISIAGSEVNLRAPALALWAGWLFLYLFTLNIPSYRGIIYAVFLVPMFIGISFLLLEVNPP